MRAGRIRSELIAWICGAGVGAIAGLGLGAWTTPAVGIFVGVVVGPLIALSIRRGRGTRGWSDVDGESTIGEGGHSEGTPRQFAKGSPSSADLPAMPGIGGAGSGPAGTGS